MTLELIEKSGVSPEIVKYLDNPPSAERIAELARVIGVPVSDLLRRGEDEFKNAGDLPDLADDSTLAAWIARHPKVLQRPIVIDDEKGAAVVGRPPENVTSLLPA